MNRRLALCVVLGVSCVGRLIARAPASDRHPGSWWMWRAARSTCCAAGAPTVILEAGASSFAIDWSLVQPEIARTNRVCAYDRVGHGWSDGSGQTSAGIVRTLHAVLQAAGETGPFVMVGASAGGLYVRLYQVRYPDEVVALVQVDPAHEDRLFTYFNGQAVAIASLTAEQLRSTFQPGPVRVPTRSPQTGPPSIGYRPTCTKFA